MHLTTQLSKIILHQSKSLANCINLTGEDSDSFFSKYNRSCYKVSDEEGISCKKISNEILQKEKMSFGFVM
ncbi:hypothetical protein EB796_017080 [Bugula neritina]|uniref:Uncharacterized protein n=1 Tax=Bugula neritina TaxID=10212 RepID=A0A7J7JG81_BUGNE|nr:hypothetical protein EB796_017080 [Bugula neritina]